MDEQIEQIARAISNCEWDQACSALGTPNHPRGGNWTAKLPQARAAHSVMAGKVAELAYREGFQHARECLSDDVAFTLTADVEEDCWRDSKTRAALAPPRHD